MNLILDSIDTTQLSTLTKALIGIAWAVFGVIGVGLLCFAAWKHLLKAFISDKEHKGEHIRSFIYDVMIFVGIMLVPTVATIVLVIINPLKEANQPPTMQVLNYFYNYLVN